MLSRVRKNALVLFAATCTLVLAGTPAWAQDGAAPSGPNSGAVSVSGSYDVVNPYMFRGIRQNLEGVAMWPTLDVGFGSGPVTVNLGTWNSLHTGDGLAWYEGDFYATVGGGLGKGASLSATYTAYNSPHGSFGTVHEIAFKLGVDDSSYLGKGALTPYVYIAQEFDTEPGAGQADGGEGAGTYLELGVAPGYSGSKAGISFPIKLGMSLNDYYELDGEDHKFGFFSVGATVTVPLGGTNLGSWSLRGGVEYQALGTMTEFYNEGDSNRIIGSFGLAFSY